MKKKFSEREQEALFEGARAIDFVVTESRRRGMPMAAGNAAKDAVILRALAWEGHDAEPSSTEVARLMDALELAWGIIANAHGGNWDEASEDWRGAANRWRDEHWHPALDRNGYSARGSAVEAGGVEDVYGDDVPETYGGGA